MKNALISFSSYTCWFGVCISNDAEWNIFDKSLCQSEKAETLKKITAMGGSTTVKTEVNINQNQQA